MRIGEWLDRELGGRRVWLFFVFATFAYVLPLILADYSYIDDNWRSLAAGLGWAGEGRLFTQLFYNAMTFSGAAPNIFPLPLLIASLAMAWALTRLTFHYFAEPRLSHCLVVLALWYNPFFLQNLSYQYDGPAMVLSLVAVIFAITFRSASRVQQWIVPALLIALAIGLYQVSINVFFGLCCLELLRFANDRRPWPEWYRLIGWKLAQTGLAWLIYGATAYAYMNQSRTLLLNWTADPLLQAEINAGRVLEKVMLLFHGGFAWVFAALLLCAAAGSVQVGRRLLERREAGQKKALIGVLCLLIVPATVVLVSGIALLFRDFNEGARTFMGFAVLMLLLFYLSHLVLAAVHERLPLLLLIPLLAMLSLSFAYGRVLMVQKTFANSALYALSYDIASRPALRDAKRIYMSVTYSDHWLSGAAGSFKQMPVLRYLLNTDYYMLAENLPKVGITNVVAERERRNATRVGYQGFVPLVDSQYYRIYLLGDYGFIVMKEPAPITALRW
ncbi:MULTISPECIES: glucosyltransferase domain-containing protein [unclassified Pseudomonas]|uniref:glucosyltransferase domain-containing protein n=1 Tax=unclassified Pseudomonas TaxID=196821 RepID=UPI0019116672|nr:MULTISPECIES: glucosyltransferase domain-containing protein [unclassified Pseudomonas]MBK5552139.1 glucosyltransferase domain-containing protein [Pseudomonas sp. TH03]MEB0224186.1 glucosyltransferase domain-containing protein [Pseudomonas sp. 5S1]MEB0294557.1 glucosyltransferase domain-containing protein [Pseudomonas sp. 10S4]WPX18911.1 glucosyltransferase domain-containing protein [Pseudomonas sp. 10S4]